MKQIKCTKCRKGNGEIKQNFTAKGIVYTFQCRNCGNVDIVWRKDDGVGPRAS